MAKVDPKGLVTNKTLGEAVDALLKGMNDMIGNFRLEVKEGFKAVAKRFDGVDTRLDRVETELSGVKDEIKGLKADLSDTVSKKDFNSFKNKFVTS